MLTNEQVIERDKIVFGEPFDWSQPTGGIARFRDLTLDRLEQLIKAGFIDLDECQNDSPTTQEFLEFMQQYPKARAHGYVISNEREDVGAVIEGLEVDRADVTTELFRDFVRLCRYADEFDDCDAGLYSWWD
jgi:hypothetical protein